MELSPTVTLSSIADERNATTQFAHLLSGCFTPNQLVRTRLDVVDSFGKYRKPVY